MEVATKGSSLLAAAGDGDELQVPDMLKPLMQGAWLVSKDTAYCAVQHKCLRIVQLWSAQAHKAVLVSYCSKPIITPMLIICWLFCRSCALYLQLKDSAESTAGAHLASSKSPSKQSLSVTANPISSRTSLTASNPQAAATTTSTSTSLWQAVRNACSSRQHYRFFQLSIDATTLRWSWNKYVLLYSVESLSSDPAQLTIVLHCVLEPDLQLTFQDAITWGQWSEGFQLALQLITGVHVSTGAAGKAPHAHEQQAGTTNAAHAMEHHHQMVRAALHTGQGVQQLHAGHRAGSKGGASWLGFGPRLSTSRYASRWNQAVDVFCLHNHRGAA